METLEFPAICFDRRTWGCLGLTTLLAFFTYFFGYWNPPHVFWDENYHIASAQKYLNGVYFMEQHPPLGKLLIAFGEKILDRNVVDNQFLGTDYGRDFPEGFSFAGYRLFPAFLGWMTAPVLFLIFLLLTGRNAWALLLSFLYVFDNALIVHLRGAMLEGALLFFLVLTILAFLLLLKFRHEPPLFERLTVFFGVAFALVMTTKVLGLILLLLIPVLVWTLWPDLRRIARFGGILAIAFLVPYCTVWYLHFALGRTINPALPDQGYYQASARYKEILQTGRQRSPLSFPVMLRDSLKFVTHYNRGTPRLDLCKVDENGSPFYFWPFGARSVNYRWETPDGQGFQYLYLQVNPVVWWGVLAGLVAAFVLLLGSKLFSLQEKLTHGFLLAVFTGVYASYMIAVSRIDRVMYLYHYFIPLLLSFIVFAIVLLELERIGSLLLTEKAKSGGLLAFGILIFLGFQYYRPLTYYEPLSDSQMQERASLFRYWELHCVHCPKLSPLVVPTKQ